MKSLICVLFSLSLLTGGFGQEAKNNSLPQVIENFQGTWIGEGKSPDGDPFKSELVFAWTLNDNFIQVTNSITANGRKEKYATTYYAWQPVLKQIVFWSLDKDGTINEGLAELAESTLKHEWRSFSKGGEIQDWRSKLEKTSADSFTFSLLDERNQEMFSIYYKRKK